MSLYPINAWTIENWQIASKSEIINFGQKIRIEIVKLQESTSWPSTFKINLSGNGNNEEIELFQVGFSADNTIHRSYAGFARKNYAGIVRAELVDASSNRIVMLAPRDDAGAMQAIETSDPENPIIVINTSSDDMNAKLIIANPDNEPALSANESMYFIMGKNSEQGTDSRFQLSFKYRPFDPEGSIAGYLPPLSNLYFAYSQTTLWNISEKSGPFRDTSYRPSMFYRWVGSGRSAFPDEWRVGAEHESNGQSGADSRSLNTLYIRPRWNFDFENGQRLSFYPKLQYFTNKEENTDIHRYRGFVDWQLRYGREDGLVFGGLYRLGTGNYSSGQLDISYPISDRIFARTGSFLHFQILSGYGETLLDYDKKNDTQVRIGVSIAR
jgi:phospholipase A1/A2